MRKLLTHLIITTSIFGLTIKSNGQPKELARTIVTTDGELDDVDSFIRLLLHSNEFNIEGLVVSSSMWHYKGDGKGTKFTSEMAMTKSLYGERTELRWPGTDWIYNLVDAYGKVYPNLKLHANFPDPAYLKSVIRIGNIDFEGEMAVDTKGSDFIKEKLLDDNTRPLYLQVWGGTNTIARALKSIEDQYKNTSQWMSIYKKVCDKAIIYAILDQDATYKKYIAVSWPDMKIYYNENQFWCLAYFWPRSVPTQLHSYLQGSFMAPKIINNHGPLLKMYYSYGDGNPPAGEIEDIYSDPNKIKKNQWGSFTQYDFISEGDSPAFLHLMDVGLRNLDNPSFGGWGGRLVRSGIAPNRWEDGDKAMDFDPYKNELDKTYPQTRWIDVLQNEFAARADWCVLPYNKANHPPVVKVNTALDLEVKPGETVRLKAITKDPDGNKVNCKWWQYQEVGTYKGKIRIQGDNKENASFVVPNDAKAGETIHIILQGSDNGVPSLTRYQRIVATITP